MMLAEPSISPTELTLKPDLKTRSKRLSDVQRGKEYQRKIDSLAERQWRSNVPQLPTINRKYSKLEPIMTSVMSDPATRYGRTKFITMTSTPRDSISMMSDTSASTILPPTGSQMSLPNIYSRDNPSDQDGYLSENMQTMFNPWGTSRSALDDQTELTREDLSPRELPFRFRDSVKHVIKPTPKQPIIMSRVAAVKRDRHQRTVTNFRSRNGTIRVIKPLEPVPEVEKFQSNYRTEMFDIEAIEREKTFMMLERIDRILHPNKKQVKSNVGSSEQEIISSRDYLSRLHSASISNQDLYDPVTPSPSRGPGSRAGSRANSRGRESVEHVMRGKDRLRDSPLGSPRVNSRIGTKSPRRNVKFADEKLGLPEILSYLDKTMEDVDTKCEGWMAKWETDFEDE